jgi:hypothetical protein
MNLSQLISDLGELTADENHVTWSEKKKTVAINLALAAISSIRPDANVETVDYELSEGSEQTLPAGVSAIIGDIRPICVGADGKEVVQTPVKKADESEITAFKYYKTKCSTSSGEFASDNTCSKWQMSGWTYDSRSPTRLIVDPPIPPGVKPKIKLTVTKCPDSFSFPADKDKTIGCKYMAELYEYALYILYDLEQESEFAQARSQKHLTAFRAMMQDGYRAESRFGSGFFKGQVGTGDPRVV